MQPQTWKFSIKPETKLDAFEKCRELNIVGVGWSHCYEDKQPKDYEEAKNIADEYWEYTVDGIRKLYEEIRPGDHLWLHKNGHYYLCIAGSQRFFAREICDDFRKYDLGHAIEAKWLKIPIELVYGTIQRGVIAPKMIQKIRLSETELKISLCLANKFQEDPNWYPEIDLQTLNGKMQSLSRDDFFAIMSPDDIEDVVASILQQEGWILLKSTCFRSKPKFEFSLIDRNSNSCFVQVKSGKYPHPLPPSEYQEYLNKNSQIVLFSTHPSPYPGSAVNGICCLSKDFIHKWMISNFELLSPTLKMMINLIGM